MWLTKYALATPKNSGVGENFEGLGAKYLGFFLLSFPQNKKRNILVFLSYFCSVCIIFEGSVFTFQFINHKIHNHVKKKHNCEFYHSKIERKHTSLEKYTN